MKIVMPIIDSNRDSFPTGTVQSSHFLQSLRQPADRFSKICLDFSRPVWDVIRTELLQLT